MRSPFITALNFSESVADIDLQSFPAAEGNLIALLDTEVAGIVSGHIVGIFLNISFRNLSDIAEHVGSGEVVILTQNSLLNEKARETVDFLLKPAIIFGRQMAQKFLRRIGRIARIETPVAHVGETLAEFLGSQRQNPAKIKGVERLDVARYHHYIVGRLVINDKPVVAVVDYSARRIDRPVEESVGVGVIFIFCIHDLKAEKPYQVNGRNNNDEPADYIFAFFEIIVFSHLCGLLGCRPPTSAAAKGLCSQRCALL